ncbi:MAG: hemolysin family protein [Christensenellales bacterium]
MDAGDTPLWIAILFLFFIGGGYFAATEIAFAGMNKLRVKTMADDGDLRAKNAMKISDNFDNALTAILIGNNVMHVGSAAIATMLATRLWGVGSVAVTTLVLTVIMFLFCEMLPKSYARNRPEQFALKVARSLYAYMRVVRPLTNLFSAFAKTVAKLFPEDDVPSYTEDELEDIMETIEDEGVLDAEEQELVQSAYTFGKKTARDILIPMDRVATIDVKAGEEEVAEALRKHKYSRFPVLDSSSHAVGVLHVNRFYRARLLGKYKGLAPLLLPMKSYPADMVIDDMMTEMNRRRQHMAVIKDGDGTLLGIVTMEDILEELVGDIYDEDDAPAGTAHRAPAPKAHT